MEQEDEKERTKYQEKGSDHNDEEYPNLKTQSYATNEIHDDSKASFEWLRAKKIN